MLVGTGQEQDVVPVEPHETRYCVGRDRFIGVADMRRPIRIGDGGSEIVAGLVSHSVFPRDTGPGRRHSDRPSPAITCPRYQPRDASASQPKTLKTNGLRSRLKTSTSRAERLIRSHTSATRASRARSSSPLAKRADSHVFTVSTKAASVAGSVP